MVERVKEVLPKNSAPESQLKRVLVVASTTGYQTRMFAEAAQRLGIELVMATDRCHVMEDPWGDHAIPLKFLSQNGSDLLRDAGPLDGVIALGDDAAEKASIAARELALRFHSPEAVAASRNKFAARERFRDAGLLVPEFYRLRATHEAAAAKFYPCVLKPLGLSASRGVIRANNDAEFIAAFERIRTLIEHEEINEYIQVERFIPGKEFALEGVVTHGLFDAIAIFDKPDPLDGPFFEETIYVTPSRESHSVQAAMVETAARAVAALGLTDGPVHAEMRVNEEGVWMLEVAARPIGGLCARAVPGLEEFLLQRAVNDDVPTPKLPKASGVMMIPIPRGGVFQSVSGLSEAGSVNGVTGIEITAKVGQRIVPLPEGKSYLGFIFSQAPEAGDAERALRKAHSRLSFEILAALPVL